MSLRDKMTIEEWDDFEKEIEAGKAAENAAQDNFELYSKTKKNANIAEYQKAFKKLGLNKGAEYFQFIGRVSRKPFLETLEKTLTGSIKKLIGRVESEEVSEIYFYEKVKFLIEKEGLANKKNFDLNDISKPLNMENFTINSINKSREFEFEIQSHTSDAYKFVTTEEAKKIINYLRKSINSL